MYLSKYTLFLAIQTFAFICLSYPQYSTLALIFNLCANLATDNLNRACQIHFIEILSLFNFLFLVKFLVYCFCSELIFTAFSHGQILDYNHRSYKTVL